MSSNNLLDDDLDYDNFVSTEIVTPEKKKKEESFDKKSKKELLLEKQAQIKAQLQAIEAREKQESRKIDTRKKVVLGAILLKESQSDHELLKVMLALIEKLDERDKKLFL